MICQLCKGDGALIEVRELWPIFATDDQPVEKKERRIICPRCHGEGNLQLRRPPHEYDELDVF